MIVNQGRPFVDYYVDLASRSGDGKSAANWVQQDVLRWLNDQQFDIARFPVPSAELAALLGKVRAGQLDTSRAREVLAGMIESGRSTEAQMQALGIQQIDDSEIDLLCRELLAANPKVVAEIKEGKTKGVGALIGQAKKQNPNANPNRVRQRCLELIQQM